MSLWGLGVLSRITSCVLVVVLSIGIFGPRSNGKRLEELCH